VAVVAFTLVSLAILAWAFEQHARPAHDYRFLLWGALVLALGIASGAVFVYGLRRRACIDDVQKVTWRPTVKLAIRVSCAAALLACFNFAADPSAGTARGVVLTVSAIVGGTPATVALLGIKQAILTTGGPEPHQEASRVQAYLELRELAAGLLRALGSLVALTTFALGASRDAMPPGTQGLVPAEIVIAFGAIGTTLVGSIYAVPNQALRHEARALVRILAPLKSNDPAALRGELDARQNVERQLGLNAGLLSDLQSAIVVLGPLLAAATTFLLPSR
jgi:hypothetical protein